MEFRVLGLLGVVHGGRTLDLPAAKVRSLLAMLLLHPNEVVSAERLTEILWDGRPPTSAANTLQGYVSKLRKTLGPDVIQTRPPGYVLAADPMSIDSCRFERLASEGRAALTRGWPEQADARLEAALALWRGPALADFMFDGFAQPEIIRLEESRLTAVEDQVDARLALGRHLELVGRLRTMVDEQPLRERRWNQSMVALYRCGRQAEALRAYAELRRVLGEELGIEPSLDLQRLEEAVLLQKPELDWTPPPPVGPPAGARAPAGPPTAVSGLPAALVREEPDPFVGRDAELARLEEQWKGAVDRGPRLVLVAGEPGVGKTRLARELAYRSWRGGAAVLFGRCDEHLAVPYQPFAEAFAGLIHGRPAEELTAGLGGLVGELVHLVPELAELAPGLPPPVRSDPETQRYRLFESVARALAAVAQRAPVVVVLDDLHWAARPTLMMLRHVVTRSEHVALLVVGTYRHTETAAADTGFETMADLDGLVRHPGVTRVTLAGLDQSGVGRLLATATGSEPGLEGSALVRSIHAATGGNPFFVGEVVRHLKESGALADDHLTWPSVWRSEGSAVPESVLGVVRHRLSRLSEATTRQLRVASVIGAEYELAVLQAATGLDEETVISGLEEAIHAGIVEEVPGPALRHRFSHALVRSALYDDLSGPRRAQLHRRVGEAIEATSAAGVADNLAELAHHFALAASGGAADKAVIYATLAADRALGQLAYDEAANWYGQALQMLQAADPGAGSEQRCDLLLALGGAQRRCGDPGHRATLLAAGDLAGRLGDAARLAQAALANSRGFWSTTLEVDKERVAALEAALQAAGEHDSEVRARLLANLAVELVYAGDLARNRRLTDEALAMAHRLGDGATLASVLAPRYNTIRGDPSTLGERLDNTAELVDVAEQLPDPMQRCWAWGWRSLAAMEAARFDEAFRGFEVFERLATELRQPTMLWYSTYCRASRVLWAGRFDEAERLSAEALALGRAAGHSDAELFWTGQWVQLQYERGNLVGLEEALVAAAALRPGSITVRSWLALVHSELGHREAAERILDGVAGTGFADLSFDPTWLLTIANSAAACALLGEEAGAAAIYEMLRPFADQVVTMSSLTYSGSVSHYLGMLAAAMHRSRAAEEHFMMAAAVHSRAGAVVWLARTRVELARTLITSGRAADAVGLLQWAADTARDHGAASVEQKARSLAAEGDLF